MIGVFSRGIAAIPHLEHFLQQPWQRVRPWTKPASLSAIAGWGHKPTARRARAYAKRHGLPYLALEDGFLRSRGPAWVDPPQSLIVDDLGIYYDSTGPSRLESLVLEAESDAKVLERGEELRRLWCSNRVSKYNHQPDTPAEIEPGYALVIDQTVGDASVTLGQASKVSFRRAFEAAMDAKPDRQVVIKTHPDVIAGRKKGYFDLREMARDDRVTLLANPHHPPALLEAAEAVYTVTSQMGFEALMWGVPTYTFGMPFYAGWGLTMDDLPAPSRRQRCPLASLVDAAILQYPNYLHPTKDVRALLQLFRSEVRVPPDE